jgi:hypothetical protein
MRSRTLPPSRARGPEDQRLSDELARWLTGEGDKTIAGLIETFKEKSFAVLFAVLLGPAALPLPTGGVTHVLEAIAMLLALQLVAGRDEVWLPRRWRNLKLVGEKRERFLERLLRMIRWLERWSRPRGRFLFGHRVSTIVFGALVLGGSLAAFVAPPFSWLDTLPALGVVLLSVGVLVEDVAVVGLGLVVGAAGVALVVAVGGAAIRVIEELASGGPATAAVRSDEPFWGVGRSLVLNARRRGR